MGTEEKYMKMVACWTRACDCEQAKNPMGKAILFTLAALGLGGLLSDSLKHAWEKYSDKKPSKHVTHKGKKVDEVKYAPRHVCDVCGKLGTSYQAEGLPYDLCKNCYKAAKKKSKEKLEAWYKKHPEEKKKDDEKSKEKKEKKRQEAFETRDAQGEEGGRSEVRSPPRLRCLREVGHQLPGRRPTLRLVQELLQGGEEEVQGEVGGLVQEAPRREEEGR